MDPLLLVGRILEEKFHVLSVLGAGGMGVVFKARQIGLQREVAIKLLHPILLQDAELRLRFEREAQTLSTLSHKHIGMFYSYGIWQNAGAPYIVMEYLEGESLAALLQRSGALSWQRALRICRQICQAMEHAHHYGIIHRDLKPSNIVLLSQPESDFVKIVDFGLAALLAEDKKAGMHLTNTGELIGSAQYFSPEQSQGKPADARSDVYSLGCILYEMLCGSPPFASDTPIGFIYKHKSEEAESLDRKVPNRLPDGLADVVQRALSKDPQDRYQSMKSFDTELQLVESNRTDELEVIRSAKYSNKRRPMRKQILLLFCLFVGVAAFGTYWFLCTDEGMYRRSEFELAGKPSQAVLLRWICKSQQLQGTNSKLANQIQGLATDAAWRNSKDFCAVASLYLRGAEQFKKSNDCASASRLAKMAIFALPKVTLSIAKTSDTYELRKLLKTASQILLSCGVKFTNMQTDDILNLANMIIETVASGIDPEFTDLCCKAIKDNNIPGRNTANVLIAKGIALAKEGYTESIMDFVHSIEYTSPGKIKPKPEKLAALYVSLTTALTKDTTQYPSAFAQSFAEKAERLLINCPACATDPDKGMLWVKAANAFLRLARFEKALQLSNMAIKLTCDNPRYSVECACARAACSSALESLGRHKEATSQALQAQQILKPNTVDVENSLSPKEMIEKKIQRGIDYTLLIRYKTHKEASLVLLDAFLKTQQTEEALSTAKTAAELEEKYLQICAPSEQSDCIASTMQLELSIAKTLINNDHNDEAEKYLRRALALKESHPFYQGVKLSVIGELMQLLCRAGRVNDTFALLKMMQEAPYLEMNNYISSNATPVSSLLAEYKKGNYPKQYFNILVWLENLFLNELESDKPKLKNLKMILKLLNDNGEKALAIRLRKSALNTAPYDSQLSPEIHSFLIDGSKVK